MTRGWVDDGGRVPDLVGVAFAYGERAITLPQSSYCDKWVAEFGSGAAKPSGQGVRTPYGGDLPLHVAEALLDDSERDPTLQ